MTIQAVRVEMTLYLPYTEDYIRQNLMHIIRDEKTTKIIDDPVVLRIKEVKDPSK